MENVWNTIYQYLATYGLKVVAAVIIFFVGRWIAKFVAKLIGKIMIKAKVDKTLANFVKSLCYIALMAFVIIASLNKLGVETTSIAVVIGAAGLAIGFALQGSLGNFAAGIMLIIFKPFKVGDFVEAAGKTGSVKEIQLFNTILTAPDNLCVIVPNGQITSASITNFTVNGTRRVDLIASISYHADLQHAKHILEQIVAQDSRVLKAPAPTVAVSELAESSVNFAVRPWVQAADYWNVYFDMTEKIKMTFDQNDIEIPYPQRDLHMIAT
jgi:small conductance mechanosensitive channel